MPTSQDAAPANDDAKISLVVATLGRRVELARLLDSLLTQTQAPREVIVVDQNPDGWLVQTIAPYLDRLPLRVLSIPARGASHARNVGLAAAIGPLVGFPDDDCWFAPGVIAATEALFATDPALSAACLPLSDANDRPIMLRWPAARAPVTRGNVWHTCLMAGFYARKQAIDAIGGFNENLGVGTALGSGEETDLALRLLSNCHRVEFVPQPGLHHPERPPVAKLKDRATSYGRGFGYVWTAHRLSTGGFYYYCLRALVGQMIALLKGDTGAARFYAASLEGRLQGRRAALNDRL